ncbi:MAG: DUF5108 domain-containing protein [Prevotella sp.]|nr:DUF5108 domain-containing protein [Prevotella sp.]MBQ2131693.1 DUF5108 domain-containing protein [Prevotella sp.]MBQ2334439.1 DUF5108 domain-containing protein [Prevotella sp.]
MKKILYHISLGLAMLLAACDDPNEGELFVTPTDLESEMSIIDVLERDSDYTMWIDFLKHANYYNALKDASSEATIFCPNNMAITAFLKNRGVSSVRDLSKNYARSVAQAHIIANTSITETTLNNYAESATYIPTQNLFGTYLTLKYGYTITDVDDAERTETVYTPDSIFINNQARLDKFTAINCANGVIYSMGTVITPLTETILEKLELENEYTIFSQAIRECGYDSIANKVRDTTNVVGGGYVVNTYNYTCFAVPDHVYKNAGISDVNSLKTWLVNNSNGEETNGDVALNNYIQYHFLLREYDTKELYHFQMEGQTLIFETKMPGQAIITNDDTGVRTINKTIQILRSDISARNGLIHKVNSIMPVYHPTPVTVRWDFMNSADIISFVNAYGADNGFGNLFTSDLTTAERKIDLSETRRNGDYGTLTSFTYKSTDSRAPVSQYPTVGFVKEQWSSTAAKTTPRYGTYMNNYMMLNLGYAGWIQFTTPSIISGKYKIVLHYCADISMTSFFSSGSLTKFELDDRSTNLYIYKGLADVISARARVLYGSVDMTLWDNIEFDTSSPHKFKVTMMDINAKTNNLYHQMYDYIEFIPID